MQWHPRLLNYLSCVLKKAILKIKYLNEINDNNVVYVLFFSIGVRAAAVSCLKNILATKSGNEFWEVYKSKADPMLIYLQPFRTPRKKVFLIHLIYMAHGVEEKEISIFFKKWIWKEFEVGFDKWHIWHQYICKSDCFCISVSHFCFTSGSFPFTLEITVLTLERCGLSFRRTIFDYLMDNVMLSQDSSVTWCIKWWKISQK